MGTDREPTDADLVARTRAGDREAFGLLYDRYARLVRVVAADAARDAATIQDLTQECFLRGFRQLATLREPERFRFWLVGIARQVVREHRRRRGHEPLVGEVAGPDQGEPADDADEIDHVLRRVAELPEDERLAVRLFYLAGRDADETAGLLGVSRSGVYVLLKRACARIARWLALPREVRP